MKHPDLILEYFKVLFSGYLTTKSKLSIKTPDYKGPLKNKKKDRRIINVCYSLLENNGNLIQ